jgi:hypothetical protein
MVTETSNLSKAAFHKEYDAKISHLKNRLLLGIDLNILTDKFKKEFDEFWKALTPLIAEKQISKKHKEMIRESFYYNLGTHMRLYTFREVEKWALTPYWLLRNDFDEDLYFREKIAYFKKKGHEDILTHVFLVNRNLLALLGGPSVLGKMVLRYRQMTAKKASPANEILYRRLAEIIMEQQELGEDQNRTQASRRLKKEKSLSEKKRKSILANFNKNPMKWLPDPYPKKPSL